MHRCVHLYVGMCIGLQVPTEASSFQFPKSGAVLIDGCELPDMDAGDRTWAL